MRIFINPSHGGNDPGACGNVIKLYDTAVHKLATPTLSGTDATDFTLILPS